jgi:hypothetical protein
MNDRMYEKPKVADYGSLADLTAANGMSDQADGQGFVPLNQDGSSGSVLPF